MNSHRIDRINSMLRNEVSKIINENIKDPRINPLISITKVKTSKDLSNSKISISLMGNDLEKTNTLKALKSASGFIRHNLQKNISLKKIPSINFTIDETIVTGQRITKLINKNKVENAD